MTLKTEAAFYRDCNCLLSRFLARFRNTVLCAFFVTLVLGLSFLLVAVQNYRRDLANYYALTEVGDMFELFWIKSGGEFPKKWSDLQSVYEEVDQGYGLGDGGMSMLQKSVEIDFSLLHSDDVDNHFSRIGGREHVFVRLRHTEDSDELSLAERDTNQRIARLLTHE